MSLLYIIKIKCHTLIQFDWSEIVLLDTATTADTKLTQILCEFSKMIRMVFTLCQRQCRPLRRCLDQPTWSSPKPTWGWWPTIPGVCQLCRPQKGVLAMGQRAAMGVVTVTVHASIATGARSFWLIKGHSSVMWCVQVRGGSCILPQIGPLETMVWGFDR